MENKAKTYIGQSNYLIEGPVGVDYIGISGDKTIVMQLSYRRYLKWSPETLDGHLHAITCVQSSDSGNRWITSDSKLQQVQILGNEYPCTNKPISFYSECGQQEWKELVQADGGTHRLNGNYILLISPFSNDKEKSSYCYKSPGDQFRLLTLKFSKGIHIESYQSGNKAYFLLVPFAWIGDVITFPFQLGIVLLYAMMHKSPTVQN
ncbi:hypothetical protein [Leptospira perolatii]|uniref:hypothetical protein n=1 Tax=Leptospira perolatii TaxID=2023191 RepID=UPI000F63FC55|nr:hypothetical protein [Leptospira perolatii]